MSKTRRISDTNEYVGRRYGRLTIIGDGGRRGKGIAYVVCRCECGSEKTVRLVHLKSGITASCGCLHRDRVTKHGLSHSATWNAWAMMVQRCVNPACDSFPRYGGKGITVCDRWLRFENFLEDMGERPPEMTIERVNGERGYSPENCRWATRKEQARNRSTNLLVEIGGVAKCVAEWAEEYGINRKCVYQRIRNGWDPVDAITTPTRARRGVLT